MITPSYNQAGYLEETIRSVLLQGYPNLEYGIMDGGSKDGSAEIIRKYSPFLTFWESRPDKGQADAINRGLARCSGQVLAYLNSDDVYEPGALFAVAREFSQGKADVMYGGFAEVDEKGSLINRHAAPQFDVGRLLLDNYIAQPSTFWSVSLRDSLGGLDTRLHYSLDCDYWLRAFAAGFRFSPVDQCLSRFRLHTQSKTVAQPARFWEDYLLSLQQLRDKETLPDAMRVMLPRAICRASLRAASSCMSQGDNGKTRAHIARAMEYVPEHPHEDELELAFQLCAMSGGNVVMPSEYRRRKKQFGFQKDRLCVAWRKRLDREYAERFVLGKPSRRQLMGALIDDPRRIGCWGFRRALLDFHTRNRDSL